MTEQTLDTPAEDTTVVQPAEAADSDANGTPEANKGNREARYRVERNEARAEAEALAQRVEALQRRELDAIASRHLAEPADLLTLGSVTLADLLDESGFVDPDKVRIAATDVLTTRPGLRKTVPATDPTQGHGSTPNVKRSPTFGDLLSS